MGTSINLVCPTCGADPGEPCRSVAARTIRSSAGVRTKIVKHLHSARVVHCHRAPMAMHTACGRRGQVDSDRWRDTQCPECLAKQPEIALHFARYCGTEFEANLENSRMRDYFDDCACQWGAEDWISLPNDKQLLVRKAFEEGRRAERAVRKERG